MSELLLTSFSDDQLPAQRKVFEECFPETVGTSAASNDHYRWKFRSFPATPPSYEFAAFTGDDLVGYYAALPYSYRYKGVEVKIGMVCDVMTGEKARGKGVFTKLGKYSTTALKENELAFTTGYPIRPEVIPGHLKAGWEIYFNLPLYGRFIDFSGFFKAKRLGFLSPFANFTNNAVQLLLRLIFTVPGKVISTEVVSATQLRNDPHLQKFIESQGTTDSFNLVKSSAFLQWRLGAPGRQYFIISLKKASTIIGYAIVTTTNRMDVHCLGILDYFILPEERNHSTFLLNKVVDFGKQKGLELILVMMSAFKAKENNLSRSGFIKTPYSFKLIIKRLNTTISSEELKDEKNWNLMWIDSDDL